MASKYQLSKGEMMSDYYQFPIIKPHEQRRIFQCPPEFDIPKYRWLKWVLKKLRLLKPSMYHQTTATYSQITISSAKIRDILIAGMSELGCYTGRRPKSIYVSNEFFEDLMRDPMMNDISITGPLPWPVKMFGAAIYITPYLHGKTILPVWED